MGVRVTPRIFVQIREKSLLLSRKLSRNGGVSDIDSELVENSDVIESARNKSRLKPKHYYKFHGKLSPQDEIEEKITPIRSQRRLFGRHGLSSGINPTNLWPTQEELLIMKEWESIAYPDNIHVMINKAMKEKEEEEEQVMTRQKYIMTRYAKLDDWKQEVLEKQRKREEEALKAKEKKQQRIEEVRQIFGFHIDPRDERFKEALEQKEKEERKAAKEAKKLEKQKKMLEKMSLMIAKENAKAKDGSNTSQVSSSQDS